MTADRDALLAHLDDLLRVEAFADHAPNGLQVEGTPDVDRIVTSVSASLELFREAVDRGADLVLVHHGMFWDDEPRPLVGPKRERVKLLLDHEVNLAAYHLPLDAHRVVGNNFVAARELGLQDLEPAFPHDGEPIGVVGRFGEPRGAEAFHDAVASYYGGEGVIFPHGPDEVVTVGIVSGAAQKQARAAAERGLDGFVTGEVSEWNMHHAREHGLHFVAAGHHRTERVGPRALGEHVAREFDVAVDFVDVPNPV